MAGPTHEQPAEPPGPAPAGAADIARGVDDAAEGGRGPREAVLPTAAQSRAVAIAAELLGTLAAVDVPASLRRVAQFAPARRARLGAPAIAAALATDVAFRQRVGELAARRWPAVTAAAREGGDVSTVDPVELATVAYLVRPAGWTDLLAGAAARLDSAAARSVVQERNDQSARLREQLEALRASSRDQLAAVRAELDDMKAANTKLRQRLGAAREAARVAEQERDRALEAAAAADAAATATTSAAEAEGRRLRARLADAEAALESTRRAARDGRTTESIRTRLLLDTLLEVSQGLRRELALPAVVSRPADLVASAEPGSSGAADAGSRGREVDDPRLLAHLLDLPMVHLIVDGYNVTKTGYGEVPLETQRSRLLAGLGALAARTSAEVTAVFDGAALDGTVRVVSPRGVRLLFSPPGVTADHVIRELARAEPSGRPVVVVSSDREVAEGVRRTGARPVASGALLRLLDGR